MKTLRRTLSFFSKWVAEVVRQPLLMLTLVAGPFLILLAFGLGAEPGGIRPRTLVVTNADQGDEPIDPLPEELDDKLRVVGSTTDLAYARRQLREGDVDLVAVLPPDPIASVSEGRHAPVQIFTSEIDPVKNSYARAYLSDQIAQLNQQTIEKAIVDAQGSLTEVADMTSQARGVLELVRSAGGDLDETRESVSELKAAVDPLAERADDLESAASTLRFVPGLGGSSQQVRDLAAAILRLKQSVDTLDGRLQGISEDGQIPSGQELDQMEADLAEVEGIVGELQTVPPEVLSAPFDLEVENVAPFVPDYVGFYGPAVLALLLQHLGMTLGSLSMVRIRILGLMELLRSSPLRPVEATVGNYLSYGLLCIVAGGGLLALLVGALNVPVFGSYAVLAGALLLLIGCALGLGFLTSLLSSSEQQAAQVAMLLLIASVFFSGFIVTLENITWPAKALSYVLPSTYAIRSLQDVMLRGIVRTPEDYIILGAACVVLFAVTVLLMRREYRPR